MDFFVDALRHGREVMALKVTYSERMSGLVDTKGKILNLPSPLFAHNLSCLLGRNILVVKTLGRFRGRLSNFRLSLPAKECSKVIYEGPALEILAGASPIHEETYCVDRPPGERLTALQPPRLRNTVNC